MQGEFTGLAHPVWSTPAGYSSPENRRGFVEFATGRATSPRRRPELRASRSATCMIIAGTPKTVDRQAAAASWRQTRPGIMALWGNDGAVSHADSLTCIRLFGEEVLPALRETAKALDLKSPFEAETPVSLDYSTDLAPRVAAAE